MIFIYNISVFLYSLAINLAALAGNDKAQKWLNGRKHIFKTIASALKPGERRIWFHCASLGEFEQGRPVMEKLKMQNPEYKILLTFFSPSGYEIRKNYPGADYIFYLPVDTRLNAKKFIEMVHPEKVFFVKYEYWYHYFKALKQRNIPLYIISAIFREGQPFFKWYGALFRKMLRCVDHFFVQDETSENRLQSIGFKNSTISGDTRFDRVVAIARDAKDIPVITKFKNGKYTFIAGSTWPQDEEIVTQLIESNPSEIEKFIIAPHEIGRDRIQSLYNKLNTNMNAGKVLLYSKANGTNVANATVIIIDNIGMLSSLYRYGNIALIGGGFGKSIHNVLEAAVFGMPIFFGPRYEKFKEANDLVRIGGAFPINNFNDLQKKLTELTADELKWKKASEISFNYVKERTGATDKIIHLVNETKD